jgi:hypothetical protein
MHLRCHTTMGAGRRGSLAAAAMVAWWPCASLKEGADASYIAKRVCRGGVNLHREGNLGVNARTRREERSRPAVKTAGGRLGAYVDSTWQRGASRGMRRLDRGSAPRYGGVARAGALERESATGVAV